MELNAAQKQAVEYLDGPLLVLAGPGTGKTQLLSQKVAYILENTDTSPENILCITFTENATANMRSRLASIIGKAANKVAISTYHSFGRDILYRYKQYSADFSRQLDAAIDDVTKFKIIKKIQKNLPPEDILKNDNIKDILNVIASAKAARLTSEDLTKIAEINTNQSASLNSEIAPLLAQTTGKRLKFDDALNNVYYPIAAILTSYSTDQPIAKQIEPLANHLLRSLSQAIDTATHADKPSVTPLTSWRRTNFEVAPDGNWRLKNVIANKKLASIAHVMDEYQKHLINNHLYDFNDMIELAITSLKKDHGFAMSLGEQYQYILLDEFQDTNPSQFELIKLITDYEKPNVMAVGDDDQAIFEFQGANASSLLDFKDYYHAKTIILTENYRCTQEILDLSRYVADQLETSFAKNQKIDKTLTAKGSANDSEDKTITHHTFLSSDAEYSWLATEIRKLIDSGTPPTEIAIIAPKHKFLIPLLPYLKDQKIDIAYEKRDNIFEDQKISQLIKFARIIHNIANEKPASHLALEVLSFPFWDLPPITAITIAHQAKQNKKSLLETLVHSDDLKLQKIAVFIAELATLSYDTPIELLINYMTGTSVTPYGITSPLMAYYKDHSTDYEIYEFYNNLHTLSNALSAHNAKTLLHLDDLINFIDECIEAEYPLQSTSPYQNSINSIQLLSAHAAKGLEFKYVFLTSVNDNAWGNAKGNNDNLVLPVNLSEIRHTGRTEDECIRLFFVALTRAKTHLIMTSPATDFSGKTFQPLQYLNGKNLPVIDHSNEDISIPVVTDNLCKSWLTHYQKLDTDLKNILLKKLENYRLTASDLTSFIDLKNAGPQTFYQEKILCAPREPASPSIMLGNVVHAVFEKVTKEKIDDASALEFYETRFAEEPFAPEDYEHYFAKGLKTIQTSLAKFGDLLRAPEALSEVDFYKDHLQLDNLLITGKIDHLQIDKKAKTIAIYDFKTGKHRTPGVRTGWNGSDLTLFKYSLQLEFYKLLLNLSPTYRNYTVTEGHILFVSPDNDGEVYDETYHFADQSSEDLITLAKAVHRHIVSLNFVDDESLNLPPNEKAGVKDIRDFISLLENARP